MSILELTQKEVVHPLGSATALGVPLTPNLVWLNPQTRRDGEIGQNESREAAPLALIS